MAGDRALRAMIDMLINSPTKVTYRRSWALLQKEEGLNLSISNEGTPPCNCIAYACGIERFPRLLKLLMERDDSVATTAFMQHLIDSGAATVKPSQELVPGDVVVYFNEEKLTHAARIVAPGLLRSKFGTAELYEHDLWNVPEPYGNDFKVVSVPEPERVMQILEEWLSQKREGHT